MRYPEVRVFVLFASLLLCLFLIERGIAQHATKPARNTLPAKSTTVGGGKDSSAGGVVKLRRLTGIGKRAMVRPPEYRTNIGGVVARDVEWCQITLQYDTALDWVDELVFQFYAITDAATIDGKKAYSFYKAAVRYGDVERGVGHICAMFLRPSAVKRFGELRAIAVEVLYKGAVVDEMTEETKAMPEKWWKNPAVVENADVVPREGYLLNRAQSPYSLVSAEGYEFIK